MRRSEWVEISHLSQYTQLQLVSFILDLSQHLAKRFDIKAPHLVWATKPPATPIRFPSLPVFHLRLMQHNQPPSLLSVILSQVRRLTIQEVFQLLQALLAELEFRHNIAQLNQQPAPPRSPFDSEEELWD